jgi:hypothetical protein
VRQLHRDLHVSDDYMNTMLRKALGPALEAAAWAGVEG